MIAKWLLGGVAAAALGVLFGNRRELLRRLKLALKVGIIGYAALYAVRLLLLPPTALQMETLATVAAIFGLIWLGARLLVQRARR